MRSRLKRCRLAKGMYPCVRARGAQKLYLFAGYPLNPVCQHVMNGICILLRLPSIIIRAVIFYEKPYVFHRQYLTKIYKMTAPKYKSQDAS